MRRRTAAFSTRHKCDLTPVTSDEMMGSSPFLGGCEKFILKLRKSFIIDKNIFSQKYFRSNAMFTKEKMRQMTNDKYKKIIHPFSSFQKTKMPIVMMCWLFVMVVEPFLISFFTKVYFDAENHPLWVLRSLEVIGQVLLNLDIISRFFTGYVDYRTGEIILEHRLIVRKYLGFFFWVDFCPNIVNVLTLYVNVIPFKYKVLIYLFKLIRGLRLITLYTYFNMCLTAIGIGNSTKDIINIVLTGGLTIHWWTCIVSIFPKLINLFNLADPAFPEHSKHDVYLPLYYYSNDVQLVATHFFGASVLSEAYFSLTTNQMFAYSMIIMSGYAYTTLSLGRILQLFGTVNISETMYEANLLQLQNFLNRIEVTPKLEKRIISYYNIRFNYKFFDEALISRTLSEHLRMEVLLHSCRNIVERVQIFKGLPRAAVGSILSHLEQRIYLPGDEIMSSDHEADVGRLFFILHGTCMVLTAYNKEALHIEDGSHFGEVKKVVKGSQLIVVYKVIALEPAEIYSLEEKDLDYCCKHFPEIADKLDNLAKLRNDFCKAIAFASSNDRMVHDDEIMNDLRFGRILQHGIKRNLFSKI